MSGFFTYLAMSSPNTDWTSLSKRFPILDSRHFVMVTVSSSFFLSYCAKQYMQQGSEIFIITSFEVGMMFTIIIKVVMNAFGMWPSTYNHYVEPSFNEEILLAHLCMKWKLDGNLPRLEKLTMIVDTLTSALRAKVSFDRKVEELALNDIGDARKFKSLLASEDWKKMQALLNEVICIDSRICYMKIE